MIDARDPKFVDAIIKLSQTNPFYFQILCQCSFKEIYSLDFVAGVRINKKGFFEFMYNPSYIEAYSDNQIKFLIIHELQHLLSNHQYRIISQALDSHLSNVAADMVINKGIVDGFGIKELPFFLVNGEKKETECTVPKEYEGTLIMEALYYYLKEHKPPMQKQTIKVSDPNGGEGEQEVEVYVDEDGNIYLDKDEVNKKYGVIDEVPKELKEALVDEMIKRAQARGYMSGGDEETLGRIRPAKRNYIKEIKSNITELMGNFKKSSWKKFSRKYDLAPGFTRTQKQMTCLLDTSGSMSGLFTKALSFIFFHNIGLNICQCDTEVKDIVQVHSISDIQRMTIHGLGGTILQPGIDKFAESKIYRQMPMVVLTDGYCDDLDFSKVVGEVLIISVGQKVNIIGGKAVKQVVVEKE